MALLVALIAGAGRNPWNDGFTEVAKRHHGTLHSGGWFRPPAVWFKRGELQARLTIQALRDSSGHGLALAVEQREIASRIEIHREGTRLSLLPLKHDLVPLSIASDEYSRHWHTRTDSADAARRLLTDGVRLTLEWFWRQPQPAEASISISPGWFVARKLWNSGRGSELMEFVDRALALADQFNLAAAVGVEFLAGEQPQLLEDARCGVCGDNLLNDIVICRRCSMPHHADCWQFTGYCSSYGCGSTECIPPSTAKMERTQQS